MLYRFAADFIVLLHFAFILFVIFGGMLALRLPRLAWLHLPAAAWGVFVEISGRLCPLTPLENHLRDLAGQPRYRQGFIDHYIMPLVYPTNLQRTEQMLLGVGCLVLNGLVYVWVIKGYRARKRAVM